MRENLSAARAAELLMQKDNITLLCHRRPDGDTVGSAFALYYALKELGKEVRVLCADALPKQYDYLYGDYTPSRVLDWPVEYVVTVDVATAGMLGGLEEKYGHMVDLCIDHHVSNVPYAKARLLDGTASAVCEILYRLCRVLPVQITDSIAVCLYTGMATDTGCFQYDNAGPETHRAVAALMEICPDVRYAWINRKMFAVKSFGRLQLDKLLIDHLECYLDGKCVLICVSQEFLKKFHVDEAELEGIAGFPLQVEGAEIGITMKEKEAGKFRISMRSADQVNVSAICQRLGGGGHVKAAGCQVEGTADEVRRILLDAVKEEWGKA